MKNEPNFSEVYSPEKEKENKATIWEYYFARKIAFLLTPIFLKLRVSANQISILAIIIGIIATVLIIVGDFWIILLGAVLLQLWLILDKLDGIIARSRKSISRFGEFLDELDGTVIAALFFSSVGVAASKFPGFLPFFFQLPSHFFIILGISTSFFVIFRHLVLRHFETIFGERKEIKNHSSLYKTALKFLGIYSLAQPFLILAIIFNFLGLYTLVYFVLQGMTMLASICILIFRASKI